ncbi:hypothetical protein D3C72_2251770 [compost metagenome]
MRVREKPIICAASTNSWLATATALPRARRITPGVKAMATVSTISHGARPSIETINSTRIRSGKASETSASQVIS